jgi:hypothetical protein
VNEQRNPATFKDIVVTNAFAAGTARADDELHAAQVDCRDRFAFALRRLLLQGGKSRLQVVGERVARFRVFDPLSVIADFTSAVVTAVIFDACETAELRPRTLRRSDARRFVGG